VAADISPPQRSADKKSENRRQRAKGEGKIGSKLNAERNKE